MLDFHAFKQADCFRNHIEIISEKRCLEVVSEVSWQLISFMETAFQTVCNLSNVWDVVIFDWLSIFFGELKLDFIGEEKFDEKLHYLAIFFQLEVVVQEHLDTPTHKKLTSTFILMDSCHWPVAWISQWA